MFLRILLTIIGFVIIYFVASPVTPLVIIGVTLGGLLISLAQCIDDYY